METGLHLPFLWNIRDHRIGVFDRENYDLVESSRIAMVFRRSGGFSRVVY